MSHTMIARISTAAGAVALGAMALAGPAGAVIDPGVPGTQGTVNMSKGTSGPAGTVDSPTADDGTIEYVQIGLGALGGVALAGAGVAAAGAARHRRQAHPA